MKKILLLIVLCQMFYIFPLMSQTGTTANQAKPATDACPTWNKKQVASKADYFAYLSKRPTAKEVNNFYTPRYRNYNAAANSSKNQMAGETKHTDQLKAKKAVSTPEKENKTIEPETESVPETKQVVVPVKDRIEEQIVSAKEKGDTISLPKKADTSKKDTGTIHIKKHLLKKLRFRKKSATSCPEF